MTNTAKAVATTIIKTDGLGRMQTPAARRESLLDEFERSGLSGAKFATLAGIKYSTFAMWAHRRRHRGSEVAPKAPVKSDDQMRWLEAVVEQAQHAGNSSPSVLLVQLPGGARVEVADEKQAALAAVLLRALTKSC